MTDTPDLIEGLAQHMANETLQVGDTPHWDRLNEDGRDIYRYEARAALDWMIAHFEARSEASDLMSESEWHNAVAGELRTLRGEP